MEGEVKGQCTGGNEMKRGVCVCACVCVCECCHGCSVDLNIVRCDWIAVDVWLIRIAWLIQEYVWRNKAINKLVFSVIWRVPNWYNTNVIKHLAVQLAALRFKVTFKQKEKDFYNRKET